MRVALHVLEVGCKKLDNLNYVFFSVPPILDHTQAGYMYVASYLASRI